MKSSLTLFPAILLALPSLASAETECATDADCAVGFQCEVVGSTGCAEPICPPGEECPEPEPCEEETFSACVPGPCASDADCGPGLLCLEVTSYDCPASPPPCDPDDEGCEPPSGSGDDCEEVTQGYCLPPYMAPCETDSDCGPGFACEATEICSCSAGPGDEEPDCTCEPGESSCTIIEMDCAADGDCPDEWTCEDVGGEGACTYDAETGEEVCEEGPTTQACVPPYYWGWGFGGTEADGESPLDSATGGSESRVTGDIDRAEPASGCQAAPGRAPAGLPALALAALALVAIRRRG